MDFEERKLVLKLYWAGNSFAQIRDSFAGLFPDRPVPAKSSLQALVARFEETGSINPICSCERKRRRQENAPPDDENVPKLVVVAAVAENPSTSTRQIENDTGVPRSTVHRYLRQAHFKSFKKERHQKLLPGDPILRMEFCEIITEQIRLDARFARKICFTDECSFGLTGDSNRQNDRIWALENPHVVNDNHDQRRASVNVWLGILGRNLVGPFFIDGNLNANKYNDMLRNEIVPAIEAIRAVEEVFYMQDGASSHTALQNRTFLNDTFPERWIGKFGPINWPPRSPDMNPCDFYLWGFIHDRLYVRNTSYANVDELKLAIQEICHQITVVMLDNTRRNFEDRLAYCTAAEGGLFEHLI